MFREFDRNTYDIDVLTNLEDAESYGLSSMANEVEENFGDYKNNRIKLDELSTENVSVFVINKQTLITSKTISARPKDQEDISFLKGAEND